MKPTEQTCDLQRIDAYLDERLSDAWWRIRATSVRVRTLPNRIAKTFAEPDVWRDAVALLGPDSAPELALGNHRSHGSGNLSSFDQTSMSQGIRAWNDM